MYDVNKVSVIEEAGLAVTVSIYIIHSHMYDILFRRYRTGIFAS